MMTLTCPNRKHADWIRLENAVGEFEAYRDYIETNGEVRTPEKVLEKLTSKYLTEKQKKVSDKNVKKLMKATDKMELMMGAALVHRLRKLSFISKRKFAEEGNFVLLTVPKIYTEEDAARGALQGEYAIPRTKYTEAWEELDRYLTLEEEGGQDTSFIRLKETKDAYIVMIEKPYYKAALGSGEKKVESLVSYFRGNDPEAIFLEDTGLVGHAVSFQGAPGLKTEDESNSKAVQEVKSVMETLSNKLVTDGKAMKYNIISNEEAKNMHEEKDKPYSGEKAFFMDDTVYFVGSDLTLEMVMHEFSHPFVRSLFENNPELAAFLLQDLQNSPEGIAIMEEVNRLYPEYNGEGKQFQEEVLVRALTAAGLKQKNAQDVTPFFLKAINNFLYHLKKLLRKIFGSSIKVSDLNANTSLEELAKILFSKESIELEKVTTEDAVAYMRDTQSYVEDILKIGDQGLVATSIRAFDIAIKQMDILKHKNYEEVRKVLLDEYQKGELSEIARGLSKYAKPMENQLKQIRNQIEYNKSHAEALVNSLFRIHNVIKKIKTHVDSLAKEPDSIDNMHKVVYYKYLLNYWEKFTDEVRTELIANGDIASDAPIYNLLNSINTGIQQIDNKSKVFQEKGILEVLSQTLEPAGERIAEKYLNIIDALRKNNAPQKLIDKWTEEYYGLTEEEQQRLQALKDKKKVKSLNGNETAEYDALINKSFAGAQITKEKIEAALNGKMPDANIFNSFFEGYMYNTDPVIGGFALFVKNHMSDVMNITQAKFNDYAKDLKDLLKKAGYNPANTTGLIEKIARRELMGKVDEKGNFIEREIWVLMSPHKDWRIALDRLNNQINTAEKDWVTENTEEAKEKLTELKAQKRDFLRKYFYQEYLPEVYAKEDLLKDDPNDPEKIGLRAAQALEDVIDRINKVSTPVTTQLDEMKLSPEVDALWREYNLLFSLRDKYGRLKDPNKIDPVTGIKGLEYKIAMRLKEYKNAEINPATGESYYEMVLRKGLFENSYNDFITQLSKRYEKGSDEYNAELDLWISQNVKVAMNKGYYKKVKEIQDEIATILEKLPETVLRKKQKELSKEYRQKIAEYLKLAKDEDNQPDALEYTQEMLQDITKMEQELEQMKKQVEKNNGLTKAENDRLKGYFAKLKRYKDRLSPAERADFDDLMAKQKRLGLPKLVLERLNYLYGELADMREKEPTSQYLDVMNAWLEEVMPAYEKSIAESEDSPVRESIVLKGKDDLYDLFRNRENYLKKLLNSNKEFKDWFMENHFEKEVYDPALMETVKVWQPSSAWTVTRATEEEAYESIEFKDVNGDDVRILGSPRRKYYIKMVKPEYKTERIIGETVDNQGNFLPRLDVQDSPFIDNDYLNMKQTDPAHYDILEAIKKHHLKNQEGSPKKSRLYLDLPRFRKNNLEVLQTKRLKEVVRSSTQGKLPLLHLMIERTKDWFRKAKDQSGSRYKWDDDMMLIRMDMFDNEVASIPVHGLYDLDIEDVSTDVNQSVLRYMFSLEKQKKLIEINPVAQSLKNIVNDPKKMSDDLNKVNKFNFLHRGLVTYLKKKGKYVRRDAINNFIEREFEGVTEAGMTKNIPFLHNATDLIFKRASTAFFALNIPSALKNAVSAKFQSMIESAAGQYLDPATLAKGEVWSGKVMTEISFNIYSRDTKPLDIQIADAFDAIRERADVKLPESMSRTFMHDLVEFSWLTNFRKWTEGQATLQLFAGMMYKEKVMHNGKKVSYMDVWELRDGKLKLKDGVDVRYSNLPTEYIIQKGETLADLAKKFSIPEEQMKKYAPEVKEGRSVKIDNSKFKELRSRMNTVSMDLNGAYDKFDQPEAQRYLAFRMISFMKRYFTTMFVKRWGFSGPFFKARGRFNPGLGDVQEGTYITVLKSFYRMFTIGARYFPHMQKQEKAAFMRFAVEVGSVVALLAILAPLLGWDPDDPDRYEKLRRRSGAMPFFGFTEDDPEHPFHLDGFMMNHLLKLSMDVRSETETFLPWPNFGLDNYMDTFTQAGSISMGPTLKSYGEIFKYLWMEATGNSKARYKKRVGPYDWQQEGGSKAMTAFAKSLGFNASTIDPVTNIKNVYGTGNR